MTNGGPEEKSGYNLSREHLNLGFWVRERGGRVVIAAIGKPAVASRLKFVNGGIRGNLTFHYIDQAMGGRLQQTGGPQGNTRETKISERDIKFYPAFG